MLYYSIMLGYNRDKGRGGGGAGFMHLIYYKKKKWMEYVVSAASQLTNITCRDIWACRRLARQDLQWLLMKQECV